MGARVAYLVVGLSIAACLGALFGCAGGNFNSGQRAPWRGNVEEACLNGGAGHASTHVTPMETIYGPRGRGVCGLECPLRVSGLANGRVTITPPATIGCPLTAALDRWIETSVQPAAYRYFGSRVIAIRQIASYGWRRRNGQTLG